MNPNYPPNQQYPYYQTNAGPPQPPWQPPSFPAQRTGWQDPRPHTPSVSAYQVQSAPYNPNTYGPMPAPPHGQSTVPNQFHNQYQAPHYNADTASWGVKFNHQHDNQPAPPLPPRPSSTNPSQVDLPMRPEQNTTSVGTQDRPNMHEAEKPAAQSRQSWRESFYSQALAEDVVSGPPPPPRPAEYQAQTRPSSQYTSSEWPHEQYSSKPPSHHYEPTKPHWTDNTNLLHTPVQQQPSRTSSQHSWNNPLPDEQGLASPEERQHKRWNSSVAVGSFPLQPQSGMTDQYQPQHQASQNYYNLGAVPEINPGQFHASVSQGFGVPSDWERFTPTDASGVPVNLPTELSSTPMIQFQKGQSPTVQYYNNMGVRPSESSYLPNTSNAPNPVTQAPLVPESGRTALNQLTAVSNELPVENKSRTNGGDVSSRQGSLSSINGGQPVQRSGTIDSVIQAWNTPVSQEGIPPLKTSTPAKPSSPKLPADERPVSPPSQSQSPERLTKSPEMPPHSTRRFSQEAVSSIATADPYKDLDPEYHSSLTRYLRMLKKEADAPSEAEKYNVFHGFMQTELRVRQALYNITPEAPIPGSPSQMKRLPTMPTVEETTAANSSSEPTLSKTPSQIRRKALRSGSADSSKPQSPPTVEAAAAAGPASQATAPLLMPSQASALEVFLPSSAASAGSAAQSKDNVSAANTLDHSDAKANTSAPGKAQPPAQLAKISTTTLNGLNSSANFRQTQQSKIEDRSLAASEHSNKLDRPSTPPKSESPKTVNAITPSSNGSSSVVVDRGEDDDAYSPGGRPRLFKPKPPVPDPRRSKKPVRDPSSVVLPQVLEEASSPSSNAPMALEDYAVREPVSTVVPSPVAAGAPGKASKQAMPSGRPLSALVGPVKFEPQRPAYQPFRYSEATPRDVPKVLLDKSADEAYSTLRNQAAESGRLLTHESTTGFIDGASPIASPTRREHQETFLGLIRRQSKAMRRGSPGPTPAPALLRVGTPLNAIKESPVSEALSALRVLLPTSLPQDGHLHEKIAAINKQVETFHDDFAFIKESVQGWDQVNKEVRKAQDEDRDKRQTESGLHIDELFNSNEISYADIGAMEEDFKLAEAERKYQEDQQELQSFIDSVYTPINERIQHEILRLTPDYVLATDMLDRESEAGSRCLSSQGNRVQMAAAMELVLHLFKKLEVRYLKLAEARFERERRRKALELAVLYTNGNIAAMKSLEKNFTAAEKLQVLDEAHEKDKRANSLMDTFDRATVRGLGDNQTYVDEVLSKIRKLKDAILRDNRQLADGTNEVDGTRQPLSAAQEALDFVLADSRTILTTSNSADKTLNDADYRVSVAKARVENSDEVMFQKLQEDKSKEDSKIVEEMVVRMDSMAKGPAEATILIQEILAKIGDDSSHQDRIKRALEEAKKRNAAKET